MSNKSGTSNQVISLPKGGGALSGIGENFSPDLHTGTGNFTIPDLDCTGDLSWTQCPPGSIQTGTLIIENIGEPESLLDWEVQSYPNWGDWEFTPASGNQTDWIPACAGMTRLK